jgi:hypothetical protein
VNVKTMGKLALVAIALLPAVARGQDAAPALQEDPRAAKFQDVERGWFVGLEAGYLGVLDAPVADPAHYPAAGTSGGFAGGMLVGMDAGVELGRHLAVSLFVLGSSATADPSYGSFSAFVGGADVRFGLLGLKDPNGYPRFVVYLHGRGGYAVSYPDGLFGTDDIFVAGGPGIEYYTRLRHFSVGLAVDYAYWLDSGASGFAIYPTVRYTF